MIKYWYLTSFSIKNKENRISGIALVTKVIGYQVVVYLASKNEWILYIAIQNSEIWVIIGNNTPEESTKKSINKKKCLTSRV